MNQSLAGFNLIAFTITSVSCALIAAANLSASPLTLRANGQAIETGQPRQIILAAVDQGIDYSAFNEEQRRFLYNNPGEIPDNGIDDDGNGWIDDYSGPWVGPASNNYFVLPQNPANNHGNGVAKISIRRLSKAQEVAPDHNLAVSYTQGLSSQWYTSVKEALDYGAKVISLSLGFGSSHVVALEKLAAMAAEKDALLVIWDIRSNHWSKSGPEQDLGVVNGKDHIIELGFIDNKKSYIANEVDLISAIYQNSSGIAATAADIAAVWAVNPSLTSAEVLSIIKNTTVAYKGTEQKESEMGGMIDPKSAIELALNMLRQ